ncbi:MAG: hypothetical protein ACREIC_02165, partial [Limisphaerales bacterium]
LQTTQRRNRAWWCHDLPRFGIELISRLAAPSFGQEGSKLCFPPAEGHANRRRRDWRDHHFTNGTAMKKPSKKERSNRRKAQLGAKRRKQRARAGH